MVSKMRNLQITQKNQTMVCRKGGKKRLWQKVQSSTGTCQRASDEDNPNLADTDSLQKENNKRNTKNIILEVSGIQRTHKNGNILIG